MVRSGETAWEKDDKPHCKRLRERESKSERKCEGEKEEYEGRRVKFGFSFARAGEKKRARVGRKMLKMWLETDRVRERTREWEGKSELWMWVLEGMQPWLIHFLFSASVGVRGNNSCTILTPLLVSRCISLVDKCDGRFFGNKNE